MHCYTRIIILSAMSVLLSFANAHAAGKMKPGLWEMRMKSDAMKNAPKTPEMSPEQIAQMKKMGIKIPMMQNGEMINQVCISKEMAEQDHTAMAQKEQQQCKTQNIKQSGNTYSMELICDSPTLKGKGMMKGSYKNNESIHSTYDFDGTSRGKSVSHHMETTGKWLASDCGDVKPVSDYKKPANDSQKKK